MELSAEIAFFGFILVTMACSCLLVGCGFWMGIRCRHIDKRASLENQHQQHMITQAKLQAQGKTP